jgi:peptide/nickel transport system substrate-binding protein
MSRRKTYGLGALTAAAALSLAACSGGSGSVQTSGSAYGAGLTSVVNASNTPSNGTLTFDLSSTPDSTDPDNTYDPFMWDLVRLYTMQLLTYRSCPGACGEQLVPGLATGLGKASADNTVWTYHLKPDVKFQNGDVVNSQDVKYGVERTYARSILPNGPNYYQVLLQDPGYPGPYVDPAKNLMGLSSVTTPNPTTIQFHLAQPFADFNYVVAIPQSTPIEPKWDTGVHSGANFQLDPESSGPYEFQSYTLDKQLTLVKNPNWHAALDPQAKQLVRKIVVNMNVNATTIDNDLLAGHADIDLAGAGVQTAAMDQILQSPALKANADNPIDGFLTFAYINLKVIPNLHCREAIEYAADKTAIQDAWGGPMGGDIASTIMPPNIIGYQQYDLYNALSQPDGDVSAAKAQLKLCGKPDGFTTGLAYRADRPQEVAAAQALAESLSSVGIRVKLDGFLSGEYYTDFAGSPSYVHAHDLGIDMGGWGADWPDGYGFLDEISNGGAIAPVGNTNIAEINDPSINSLFAKAADDSSQSGRTAIWSRIDKMIMGMAAILPMVYQKVVLYRNPDLTNVYVDQSFGMYNYAVIGLKS